MLQGILVAGDGGSARHLPAKCGATISAMKERILTDANNADDAMIRKAVADRIVATTSNWTQDTTFAEIRAGFEALIAGPEPGDVRDIAIAGLPATLTAPQNGAPERPDQQGRDQPGIVLFCHGGGFQIGSPRSHRSLLCRLAEAARVPVLAPDYRLAPEHRFPAAVEDCLAVYKAMIAGGQRPERIIVAGDSAGGNLALGVALQAREQGLGMPAGIVLISPWLDLTLRGESYSSRAGVDLFSKPAQLRAMARSYLGRGGEATHPLATPLDAPLSGLPPMLVHAGDFDITLDDSVLLAERSQAAGVTCDLRVWPEMYHHFQVFAALPEARESLEDIGQFIRARLGLPA